MSPPDEHPPSQPGKTPRLAAQSDPVPNTAGSAPVTVDSRYNTTPVANRFSGSHTFIHYPLHAPERKTRLATDLEGYFLGPMPVKKFLNQLMPRNELERPVNTFKSIKFPNGKKKTIRERLIYKKVVPVARRFVKSLSVSNISDLRDDIAPDISFYRHGTTDDTLPTVNFPAMELFCEIKSARWFDPWTDKHSRSYLDGEDSDEDQEGLDETPESPDECDEDQWTESEDSDDDDDDDAHDPRRTAAEAREEPRAKQEPVSQSHGFPFEKPTKRGSDVRGQFASYMSAMTGSQYRFFGFCFGIFYDMARLIRWDASGVIVSEAFNYTTTDYLAEFLWRFDGMTDSERGHDTSVVPISDEDARRLVPDFKDRLELSQPTKPYPDDSGTGAREKVHRLTAHRYFCTMTLPDHVDGSTSTTLVVSFPPKRLPRSLIGRITRPFYAYDTKQGKVVFVKQYWRACVQGSEVQKEADIYKLLTSAGVRFLPVLNGGNDIDGSTTLTSLIKAQHPGWACKTKELTPYRLYRLSLVTLGRPLGEFETPLELVRCLRDAMTCHDDALFKAGFLHRDISLANIMIDSDGHGFLADWDLAIPVNAPMTYGPRRPDRTASWQFLSYNLLINQQVPQSVSDDRESAFWVLVECLVVLVTSDVETATQKLQFLEGALTWANAKRPLGVTLALKNMFSSLKHIADDLACRYAHANQRDPQDATVARAFNREGLQAERNRVKQLEYEAALPLLEHQGGLVQALDLMIGTMVLDAAAEFKFPPRKGLNMALFSVAKGPGKRDHETFTADIDTDNPDHRTVLNTVFPISSTASFWGAPQPPPGALVQNPDVQGNAASPEGHSNRRVSGLPLRRSERLRNK